MARLDPRFNAVDVIRIVENNLSLADKRVVFAWFFSLIPIKEPKVDVVSILLDLIAAIPVAGTAAKILQVSVEVAQVAIDIANLFQFEFEEQDVELAKALSDLEILREEFREQREELLKVQVDFDEERERANALLATQELLEDEIRMLEQQIRAGVPQNFEQIITALEAIRFSADNIDENTGIVLGPRGIHLTQVNNSLIQIRRRIREILEVLNG